MKAALESLLESLQEGSNEPVYLIAGNPVLTEPAAQRLAERLAERGGAEVEVVRRPGRLGDLLGDLRTFSLFAGCRVFLVIESALFADRKAAAELVDQAAEAVPVSSDEADLDRAERIAASRLLQVLRLFEVDPHGGSPADVLASLPDWAFQGAPAKGRRKRSKAKVNELREALAPLLDKARRAGLSGTAESDTAEIGAILDDGLPPGHALVMAESAVASDHPLVERLRRREALIEMGEVESSRRGGWSGLDALAEQLASQTGVEIAADALAELGRRTLQQGEGGRSPRAEVDSSARFAAEYRKVASLVGEGRIELEHVRDQVEDRGQEDIFKILDAIGEGHAAEALRRVDRYLAASPDERSAQFMLFGMVASFCRELTACASAIEITGVATGVTHYGRFKSSLAPRLQGDLDGSKSPLAGVHPFKLHRVYLAASRLPKELLRELPWRLLETELRMKGESRDSRSALDFLVMRLATA
ncbi:MAG: hypothetical protein R3244_02300 [Thermoanaerobaculia bacterium]|nr:hypothetical protein [Thermoanaerobaculia bacterium]